MRWVKRGVGAVLALCFALGLTAVQAQERACAEQADPMLQALCLIAKIRPADPPATAEPDLVIGDLEIQRAIAIWVKGEGEILIDDRTILQAVDLWVRAARWTSLL